MNHFELHPCIEQDSVLVGHFELCQVRLQNDCQYPWLILVPKRHAITEIYQLDKSDQQQLLEESSYLAEQMVNIYRADKINIAAIGNMVPQLHVHHIARYRIDKAWPAPVWGKFESIAYSAKRLAEQLELLSKRLNFKFQES